MLSFFPLDVLDEIWDVIESVSEGFLTYSCVCFSGVGTLLAIDGFISWIISYGLLLLDTLKMSNGYFKKTMPLAMCLALPINGK